MWEAIQSTIRRSRMIIVVMGMLLVTLGGVVGGAWIGSAEGALTGAVAALTHHPNDRLNIDYVVTEVNHFCNQLPQERSKVLGRYLKPTYPEVYRVEVTTLDAAVQYRPPRATRRPRQRLATARAWARRSSCEAIQSYSISACEKPGIR